MAKKKRTRRSASSPTSVAPSLPSYEELLAARHYMNEMHSCVRQAEREVRSARTINTFAIRDVRVAAAAEKLMDCRSDAAEATFKFEDMKRKANA